MQLAMGSLGSKQFALSLVDGNNTLLVNTSSVIPM